jgi:hypothetical protein
MRVKGLPGDKSEKKKQKQKQSPDQTPMQSYSSLLSQIIPLQMAHVKILDVIK